MSAFIVTQETMNLCVEGIVMAHKGTSRTFMGFNPATHKQLIGDMLFALNAESVNQRYTSSNEVAEKFEHNGNNFPPSMIQAIKSMECVAYQCCEGNCDKSPVYLALEEALGKLSRTFVSMSEDWNKAKWD